MLLLVAIVVVLYCVTSACGNPGLSSASNFVYFTPIYYYYYYYDSVIIEYRFIRIFINTMKFYAQLYIYWYLNIFNMTLLHMLDTHDFTCTGIEIRNYFVQCIRMCEIASITRLGRITSCSKCTVPMYNQCTRMSFKNVFGSLVFVSCRCLCCVVVLPWLRLRFFWGGTSGAF
jgi:hypothetical protein